VANTRGFTNQRQLVRHFAAHGRDFGAVDEDQYEFLADCFFAPGRAEGVRECNRKNGDVIRFSQLTDEFGVVNRDMLILTYYKPVPCSSLPPAAPRYNCHGEKTNLLYFQKECSG
jgi:pyocin large subunit-like protein